MNVQPSGWHQIVIGVGVAIIGVGLAFVVPREWQTFIGFASVVVGLGIVVAGLISIEMDRRLRRSGTRPDLMVFRRLRASGVRLRNQKLGTADDLLAWKTRAAYWNHEVILQLEHTG